MAHTTNLTRYGIEIAIPHVVNWRWCCPVHGQPPKSGPVSILDHGSIRNAGPFIVYDKSNGCSPYMVEEINVVSWMDFACVRGGNHPLRTYDWVLRKIVPGDHALFYHPEQGEEFYPRYAAVLAGLRASDEALGLLEAYIVSVRGDPYLAEMTRRWRDDAAQ